MGAIAIVAVLAYGLSECGAEQKVPPALATLSPERVAQCADLLVQAEKAGMIRQRPEANRINVEDRLWAAFPASSKDGLLRALACEAWNGRQLTGIDYVVAYGFRSGRRLAMFSEAGVRYE